MKYIKYLIFLIVSFVPINALAYGVQLSCPTSVKSNETFICTIYSPSYCSEITMELVLPEGFILKNNNPGKNFKSLSEGKNLSYTATGNIDRILSTLTITAPSSSQSNSFIELKNLKYKYTEKDSEYTITANISERIEFKGSTTPTTNNINNFILTLDSNNNTDEKQTLSCSPSNGKCEVSLINANIPTKEGFIFNGWGVNKDCQSGEKNSYVLNKDTLLYACFTSNMIGHLKTLSIEGYSINFDPNIYNYELYVKEDETKLNIKAEGYSSNAKIDIDNPELSNDENIITINITEDGITTQYIIKVNKGNQNISLINNIEISGYDLNFNKDTLEYNLKISGKETSLGITTEPNNNAEIQIIGNENLFDGSIIMIVAKSGELSQMYTIHISFGTSNNMIYYIFIGGIIIFMFIVYFVVKKIKIKKGELPNNKPKKENKKKKTIKEVPILDKAIEKTKTSDPPKEEIETLDI